MKQFRTVKRKAKVGERILITNRDSEDDPYKNGDVLTVKGVGRDGVNYKTAISGFVFHEEYEVIIEEVNPNEENEMETKQLTEYSYEELLDAIKAKAQAEVRKLTIDGKEIVNAITNYGGAAKSTGVISAELLARVNSHKTPQQQRDEIIEQAKRDVAELAKNGFARNEYDDKRVVKFNINKAKRTVVVLLSGYLTGIIYEKGIAKCAPTDCFNVHIGKAIALRRALGLEVPSEYLTVPQPTEVRVGDVVYISSLYSRVTAVDAPCAAGSGYVGLATAQYWVRRSKSKIIDDSREGE
jgi:hypothetical protein